MSLPSLEELLSIETKAPGIYIGQCLSGSRNRVFGGHLAAQAFWAAASSTVRDQAPHSLHASFLRSGVPDRDIAYTVTNLKRGRSLTTHRVDADQDGRGLFTAVISFHTPEPSLDRQVVMPDAPAPDQLRDDRYVPPGTNGHVRELFDFRFVDPTFTEDDVAVPPKQLIWFRTAAPVSSDPWVHAAMLVYASDLWLGRTAQLPLREINTRRYGASLDFAVWFHRGLRMGEWLLLDVESTTYADSRALSTGRVFAGDGRLVATTSQEVLIRLGTEAIGSRAAKGHCGQGRQGSSHHR